MGKYAEQETVSDYHGFRMYQFDCGGAAARVVEPRQPLSGQWVWKGEYFEAFEEFQLRMLDRGFTLGFIGVAGNLVGDPKSLDHWEPFYEMMVGKGFSPRPVMFGQSRGALYIYNWALRHPDRIGCLYGDNPVCDFRSWPRGKDPALWQRVLDTYHFSSDAEAVAWRGNPVDQLEKLARAGIPVVHVAATGDTTVPIAENTDVVEKRYRELGGNIRVFRQAGEHHPHGLPDSTPVVEWIMANSLGIEK